jgi:hypothetical protein
MKKYALLAAVALLAAFSVLADERFVVRLNGTSPQTWTNLPTTDGGVGDSIGIQCTTAIRYKCSGIANPPVFDGGIADPEIDIGDVYKIRLRPGTQKCMFWHTSGTGSIVCNLYSVY